MASVVIVHAMPPTGHATQNTSMHKNDAVVELTLPEDNDQIFASKYHTVLPSKDELMGLLNEVDGGE